ncbi:hypothetical protein [Halorubrum ezzemoulense]|uniref:hypothetical protein n=1 Tax=Halorubrum ezzemoulense TaxID=337243 RepID=UPI00232D41EB|nr:hypothetical protein [Halorubrum ezzemoulense]MDB2242109.1 hypothetical protein [Halorubrum ezzemoulense]
MSQLLLLTFLIWTVLAVVVGFHANGHNRSTLFWSGLTLITGIFGVIIYLLFITSKGTERPEEGIETSTEFAYLFVAVGGAIAAILVAQVMVQSLRVLTLPPVTNLGRRVSPLEPLFPLIIGSAALGGLIGGVMLYQQGGTRRFMYVLSYVPTVMVGLLTYPVLISLIGEPEGLFYGGYRAILTPLAVFLPTMVFILGWQVVLDKIPVISTWIEKPEPGLPSVDQHKRRQILGLAGIATTSLLGYGIFGENPHRKEQVKDNKIIVPEEFEVEDLSHGYFENVDEYRVTATVTTSENLVVAEAEVEWFTGRGVGLGSSHVPLDFGFQGNEPAQLEAVVDGEGPFSFEPSEVERFELEISRRSY